MPEIAKKWPDILPPADLLEKIDGVESGLRQRRRLGNVGWIGALIASALQVLVVLHNDSWLPELCKAVGDLEWQQVLQRVPSLLPLFLLAFCLVLIGWAKFWLKESQEPFRYSCSIGNLSPVGVKDREDKTSPLFLDLEEKLSWLPRDLEERLSHRVSRLSFVADPPESPGTARSLESHIHISAFYAIRKDRDDCWTLEIMPRVRVGPPETPETLAYPVLYKLGQDADLDVGSSQTGSKFLNRDEYEKIAERFYFKVATKVYQQIQKDVRRKIDLLPTSYFRAVAYFHEAEDYARSNTLDAYKEASKLYREAIELFDSSLRPLPQFGLQRYLSHWWRWCVQWSYRIPKRWASFLWPRLAQVEVMCARSEIGYAKMLLYIRILAGMSGDRLNPIFEARPLSLDAVDRLEKLPKDVPAYTATLFDACVTRALALSRLEFVREPKEWLSKAQSLDPNRAEEDPLYLFVGGELEPCLTSKMDFYRRAVELDQRFEVAQCSLAYTFERRWRRLPTFEKNVAKLVLREYEKVLLMNPGNLAASANRGYINWLLEDKKTAKEDFERGRQSKTIKQNTFVSELDYGLARMAAEEGEFDKAYEHYIDAVAALLAEGATHTDVSAPYYFESIDEKLLDRFSRYKKTVEGKYRSDQKSLSRRIRRSVYAFVLNDYGEACLYRYGRAGDADFLRLAGEAFEEAIRLNPEYVLPRYNHGFVERENERFEAAEADLVEVNRLQPNWPEGQFTLAQIRADLPKMFWGSADRKNQEAKAKRTEAEQKRQIARKKWEEARKSGSVLSAQNLEEEAEQLTAQADQLETDAQRLDSEAQTCRDKAKKQAEQLGAPPDDSLLPHLWLRSRDKPLERGALDWRVFHRRDFESELKWEREFDDRHARALLTMAIGLQSKAQVVPTEEGELLNRQVGDLLERLGKSFWPHNIDRLIAWRAWWEKKNLWDRLIWKESINKDIRAVIEGWLSDDPTSYWALSWVDDESFKPPFLGDMEENKRFWVQVLNQPDLSCFAYNLLGKELQKLEFEDQWAIASEILSAPNLSTLARGWLEAQLKTIAAKDQDQQGTKATLLDAKDRIYRSRSTFKWFGDQLQKIGARDEAQVAYRQAEETLKREITGDLIDEKPEISAETRHRETGCVRWALQKYEKAIEEFDTLSAQKGKPGGQWRKEVIQEVVGTIDSFESYLTLRDWLQREISGAKGDLKARQDAQEAILLLARSKYLDVFHGSPERQAGGGSAKQFERIGVEAGLGVFPEAVDWPSHPLIKKYAPKMRGRIRDELGVSIPPLKFRNDRFRPANSYLFRIDEVPLVTGSVEPECLFHQNYSALQNSLPVPLSELRIAPNPRTGKAGVWVPKSVEIPTEEEPPWHCSEYMIYELERVLRLNLVAFLGPQEVSDTLDGWQKAGNGEQAKERGELIAQVLPDLSSKLRFVQVLKSLVQECVPIVGLQTILESLTSNRLTDADVGPAVETVRLALREVLPGNLPDSYFFRLAPAFENEVNRWVGHAKGKTFFAIPAESIELLVSSVRSALSAVKEGRQVIVTQEQGIRPFVRRLIEAEFPQVAVLSCEELGRSLRRSVAGVIQYGP